MEQEPRWWKSAAVWWHGAMPPRRYEMVNAGSRAMRDVRNGTSNQTSACRSASPRLARNANHSRNVQHNDGRVSNNERANRNDSVWLQYAAARTAAVAHHAQTSMILQNPQATRHD
jgi:hypothetical protein